nr:3-phosphoshikimate 1-carboxyvinyltransferase [Hellea sp.]
MSLAPIFLNAKSASYRLIAVSQQTIKVEMNYMPTTSHKMGPLKGKIFAPGDKSISHRSLILGAMAGGETNITGLLEGADIMATAEAMNKLGAGVERIKKGEWIIQGCGKAGLISPSEPIDCGNAGTGVRLLMGAISGYKISATFKGDASLSSRPMARVLNPLKQMGIEYNCNEGETLPATIISSGDLKAIDYVSPHASAQVKSAILLAGVNTNGVTSITEHTLSRDHSENMLKAFEATINVEPQGQGQKVSIKGPVTLKGTNINIPGDPSSAAFPIVAAIITPGSDILVQNVMMNPTRTGLFTTLTEMGAYLRADNYRTSGGEIIADIHVKYSQLNGVIVPKERAPSMIDEYPILAVAAAYAKGTTTMRGISEMRVKESDRINATFELLAGNGVDVKEYPDGLLVKGGSVIGGGDTVLTHHDHRIAMSALILGINSENPIKIDDSSMIATSFPTFFTSMAEIGAKIEVPQ